MGPDNPRMFEVRQILADDGRIYEAQWRVPEIGERYFRSGTNHVAVLRQTCNSSRWTVDRECVLDEDGRPKSRVEDGVRKVSVRKEWL